MPRKSIFFGLIASILWTQAGSADCAKTNASFDFWWPKCKAGPIGGARSWCTHDPEEVWDSIAEIDGCSMSNDPYRAKLQRQPDEKPKERERELSSEEASKYTTPELRAAYLCRRNPTLDGRVKRYIDCLDEATKHSKSVDETIAQAKSSMDIHHLHDWMSDSCALYKRTSPSLAKSMGCDRFEEAFREAEKRIANSNSQPKTSSESVKASPQPTERSGAKSQARQGEERCGSIEVIKGNRCHNMTWNWQAKFTNNCDVRYVIRYDKVYADGTTFRMSRPMNPHTTEADDYFGSCQQLMKAVPANENE